MAETELERMVLRLVTDVEGYIGPLKKAVNQTQRSAREITTLGKKIEAIGKSFTKAGQGMRRFGSQLTMRVTAPLLLMGVASAKVFASFDKAMVESTAIMQVTQDQIDQMRETALSLSARGAVLQGPRELAGAYFFLASAGKTAEQSMALLPKVAMFATAGTFDMALATDLLTDAQSALGMTNKNVARDTLNLVRVSDVLVKANTLANASVRQFSVAITSKAGAALKSYNKDVEEGVAVLAALADQGVKAELAGNALDRVIRLSSKGALDNAKAHKELGFRVFDESGKMRNLGDIVANLESSLAGMTDMQRAAALDALGFEARVQGVILPLLGTSDAIKRYEKELRIAGGTTKDVWSKQMKAFSNQLKVLWNQLKVVGIGIGKVLTPMLVALGRRVTQGIKLWEGLSLEVRKVIVVVALVVGALGPLLIGFGSMLSLLGLAATGLGILVAKLGLLLSPIVLVSAAVISLGTYVLFYTEVGGKAIAWFQQQWQSLIDYLQPAIRGITNAIRANQINLAFKILWAQIQLTWAQGIRPLQEAWIGFVFTFKQIFAEGVAYIRTLWQDASNSLAVMFLEIRGNIDKAFDVQGALDVLADMNRMALDEISRSRDAAIKTAEDTVIRSMDTVQKHIRSLQGQMEDLATEAKAAADEIGIKPAEIGAEELRKPGPVLPMPKLQELGRYVSPGVEAIRRGSVQEAVLKQEHRIAMAAGEKDVQNKQLDALEEIVKNTGGQEEQWRQGWPPEMQIVDARIGG